MAERIFVVPTAEQLHSSLVCFGQTVGALASYRAQQMNEQWIQASSLMLASEIGQRLTPEDCEQVVAEFEEEGSGSALAVLFLEISYINLLFRDLASDQWIDLPEVDPAAIDMIGTVSGDPMNWVDVGKAEAVYDSIAHLMSRLPAWLRKTLEVLLEVLKILRGAG